MDKPLDRKKKHADMVGMLPKKSNQPSWHYSNDFYDSQRWMSSSPYERDTLDSEDEPGELIWYDVTPSMGDYMSHFFRNDAIKISNSDRGFFLKLNFINEVKGFQTLVPHSKIFTVINYQDMQDAMFRAKSRTLTSKTLRYWLEHHEYRTQGFVFDIKKLFNGNKNKYVEEIAAAYDYFGLDDFAEVKNDLLDYRKAYIESNMSFDVKII
jgi:hypothetical protein